LGGSQRSLELKYKTASELFHKGICKRIWILSRPGKTEYSKSLRRNLTNDECSLLLLLGGRLKKYWRIGVHWLIAVKNYLLETFNDNIVQNLAAYP